ncbi:MAG: malto-oligosyltrehalose trehalohydrolase [Acidimicrobiia bacterium]|nr:malto-oligosyltrehalose trehalohydrolase [Acidimicrobiia bacterium]
MTRLDVWAPNAARVEVVVGEGERVAMELAGDGWWWSEVASLAPGQDYRFSLDGGDPMPDPRSPWQPAGVHGPSRVVDHAAFGWTDSSWSTFDLADAVVYELHIGTFSPEGTFDGAVPYLDHLVDLGVNTVEVMPVNQFPGARGWGYDGVDLYAPQHEYGGPDGFKRLVDACHARGLAVILDVVYNHLGPDGNYLGAFGPYFTDRYSTPWGMAPNLDGAESDNVRSFIVDNAVMWMRDYHVDGLRLDATHAIVDMSALHILEQLVDAVWALDPTRWVIAESDRNDPRLVWARGGGGYGLDAQWSDDFHHALHAALTGERQGYYADFGPLADIATAWRNAYVYDGRYSVFRRRHHGRSPGAGISGARFFGYLQDHDQVGNRARGDRSSHLLTQPHLEAAAALVLLSPFVPMLFQGEEWGASTPFQYFTDHQDPELAKAVSEGRAREHAGFGGEVPDPQDPATFERSRLDWRERESSPHRELLEWHRLLLALRRSDAVAALRGAKLGDDHVAWDEGGRWLVIDRGPVAIVANVGEHAVRVPLPGASNRELLAASPSCGEAVAVHGDAVELPPGAAVLGGVSGG